MNDIQSLPPERIAGRNVINHKAEDLGHIEDVVRDPESGRMAYAIIEFGGLWGLGGKFYVVPVEALSVSSPDAAIETFVLSGIERETLESMPVMGREELADTRTPAWRQKIEAQFDRLKQRGAQSSL
jgi:sporulation protein YlmC with PRC-barrel domain